MKESIIGVLAFIILVVGIVWGIAALIVKATNIADTRNCLGRWADSDFQVRHLSLLTGCQLSKDGVIWMPEEYYLKRG